MPHLTQHTDVTGSMSSVIAMVISITASIHIIGIINNAIGICIGISL
jgi:hypothetical protein